MTSIKTDGPVGTRLLFEDDASRVWLLALEPGESTAWHNHACDYIFVVTSATPVRTEYVDGTVEDQDDVVGVTSYRKADVAHRLVNTGAQMYRNIVIELKAHPRVAD